nr:efflux RND transporter periplasmic adaptor subunit [Gemmatimonadaceae bacterium]
VLEKNVTVGQRIMAGEPLYRVADLSSVWVDAEVYERDLGAMRVGQHVAATFDALPGVSMAGRIAYVYPTLSPDTRTARVRVSLPNPASRLMPGMYATLRIESDARGAVLTVPRGAVLATGDRHLVFVRLANGQLQPRTVEVGAASDARVEILQGVALGDTVVASATFLVDAESNLGSALGGTGNMPGMDMTAPVPLPAKKGGGARP